MATISPEALERLRAWEFDGQDADDLRALLDAYDAARAQVDAARELTERFGKPPTHQSSAYGDAMRDVLSAMDEAKAGRR